VPARESRLAALSSGSRSPCSPGPGVAPAWPAAQAPLPSWH